MMRHGGAYLIKCNNGRVYVGSSQDVRNRWSQHKCLLRQGKHHSRSLQADWDKLGSDAFTFELVRLVDERSERLRLEQALLDAIQPFGAAGYNAATLSTSTAGVKRTPEAIEKMAARFRGKPLTQSHRAAIAAGGTGKKRSEETRAKQRASALLNNSQRGRPLTPRQMAAMHKSGEEHSWYGRRHSDETKALLSAIKSHPIEQLIGDTVVRRWESATAAASSLGLKGPSSILRAANQNRKAAGFCWRKAS